MHIKRERRCVACREPKTQNELLRLARIDNEYKLDPMHKLGGRGAYVCRTHECINKTISKRMFNRSFKTNLPESIYIELGQYEENN